MKIKNIEITKASERHLEYVPEIEQALKDARDDLTDAKNAAEKDAAEGQIKVLEAKLAALKG